MNDDICSKSRSPLFLIVVALFMSATVLVPPAEAGFYRGVFTGTVTLADAPATVSVGDHLVVEYEFDEFAQGDEGIFGGLFGAEWIMVTIGGESATAVARRDIFWGGAFCCGEDVDPVATAYYAMGQLPNSFGIAAPVSFGAFLEKPFESEDFSSLPTKLDFDDFGRREFSMGAFGMPSSVRGDLESLSFHVVPEPISLAMLTVAALALTGRRKSIR